MPSNCSHDKDLLLAAAEGRLTSAEQAALQPLLAACPECRADYAQLCMLHQAAAAWVDAPVPAWRRESAMPKAERAHLAWPNWLSLGASCAALVLVLLQVDVTRSEQGLRVSFGGAAPTGAELERRFKDFELRQAAAVEARLVEQEDLNRDTARELIKVVATQNQRERREDLETLLTYWKAQRATDKERLERKVDTVESQQQRNARLLAELLRSVGDSPIPDPETQTKTESL